ILRAGKPFEEVRPAAHDEARRLALVEAAGPDGKAALDEILREPVQLVADLAAQALELGARLHERIARKMGVEEIGSLRELRARDTRRQIDDAVFHLVVVADQ